jgi:hypothetical protein
MKKMLPWVKSHQKDSSSYFVCTLGLILYLSLVSLNFGQLYLILKDVLCSHAYLKSQSLIFKSNGYCFFTFSSSHLLPHYVIFY